MVIDINLDDGLLDGMAAMQKFCKIAVTEPDVSKVRHQGKDTVSVVVYIFGCRCLHTPTPAATRPISYRTTTLANLLIGPWVVRLSFFSRKSSARPTPYPSTCNPC